jgi:hypothetical protein
MSNLNGISSEIATILADKPSAPFLFVGSGFSRRYIGLETWSELLSTFSSGVKKFDYYAGAADGSLPLAAKYLAEDYFEYWWQDAQFEQTRQSQGSKMGKRTSPLKLEISKYLRQKSKTTPSSV